MKNFSRISDIKREITQLLKATPDDKFPETMTYQEDGNIDQYKITIELVDKDHFIDSKGRKWYRYEK
jgi:hypothetical protein